jgi:hypothetical protein
MNQEITDKHDENLENKSLIRWLVTRSTSCYKHPHTIKKELSRGNPQVQNHRHKLEKRSWEKENPAARLSHTTSGKLQAGKNFERGNELRSAAETLRDEH